MVIKGILSPEKAANPGKDTVNIYSKEGKTVFAHGEYIFKTVAIISQPIMMNTIPLILRHFECSFRNNASLVKPLDNLV